MEQIVFYIVGPNSDEIFSEVWNFLWNTVEITGVIHNDSTRWGSMIQNVIEVRRPADIVKCTFDKIVICGETAFAEAVKEVLVSQMGIPEDRVVPYYAYYDFNVGCHCVNWDNMYRKQDIVNGLLKCDTLNDLEEYYYRQPHRKIEKYAHYFEVYDRHFQKYRGRECVIVEVGVFKGGSLQMWKNYFGEKAHIIGIDIEESVKAFEEEQISIEIGSQSDREFWKCFKEKYPKVDIFIDDGGHTMEQQIVTFEEMFEHIAEDGVYLCEDIHTSYWNRYGGGYKNDNSFIEYSKNFIDYIHAWYSADVRLQKNSLTTSMKSLHYYDSVLVIEKRKMKRAMSIHMGEQT